MSLSTCCPVLALKSIAFRFASRAVEYFRKAPGPMPHRRVIKGTTTLWANPPAEVAQSEKDRRAANLLKVIGRQGNYLLVSFHQMLEEERWKRLFIMEMEVPKVEKRLGSSSLAEVDEPCVLSQESGVNGQILVVFLRDAEIEDVTTSA